MKEEALALVRGLNDPGRALNLLREYLQASVLRSLHESEAFINLAFVGGTALRFLHNLPRFSEDMDFSVLRAAGYEPVRWMAKIKRDLSAAGFETQLNWNDRKPVHVAWIRVGELLQEAGLTDLRAQKLSIKLEIDTRPPEGAVSRTTIVQRHKIFSVRCFDLPSLMGGKVHALIVRPYPKGRDWYDLVWYRSQRPPVQPNLPLLQHALDQTEGLKKLDAMNWRELVTGRLHKLAAAVLQADASPFLEHPGDVEWLSAKNLRSVLREK